MCGGFVINYTAKDTECETDIVLSEFDIPVIAIPFVTMADAARIEVLLTLTPEA